MAYEKPGVTVKQVQTTVSPNLAPPNLNACIIGVPYLVAETTDEDRHVYTDDTFTTVSGYNNTSGSVAYLNVADEATIEEDSVYVDILTSAGNWYHVDSSKYSVNTSANTVTISGSLGATLNSGTIKVGYRAALSGLNDYFTVDSLESVEDKIGKATSYNPLAFGLKQALANANAVVSAYGCLEDTAGEHQKARDELALHEVYALAPLTHQNVWSSYASYVTSQSLETNKHERIVFTNPKWTWYESDGTTSTTGPLDTDTDKTGTVSGLAASAFSVKNKRVFQVNPDIVYITETRPLATVKQSYLALLTTLVSTYGLYAQFTTSWTYGPGTTSEKKYYAGDNITDAAWVHLMDNDYGYPGQTITVSVPVPGYYMSAALAGKVSGSEPQQGFTNLSIAGDFSKLKYSGDYFSESQLNTLAGGGNYVMWQSNTSSPIVTRHQLSTDRSSVEKQELSITKSIDFVAKFIRDGVSPYIGSYNITPAFLTLIRQLITGYGTYLKREGYINDLKVEKVEQDSISKDTVLVTFSLSVQYPVNYIRITLQF
jgi:hypothetical protein